MYAPKKLICTYITIGFKGQTEVLARLFNLVTSNEIQVPLYEDFSNSNMTNMTFLEGYVSALLQNAFPHLQR